MFGCVAGLMFSTSASEPVEPDCVLVEHVEQQEVGLFTVEAFPREFTGSFLWDTDQTPRNEQSVRYTIDSVSERGEILLATGTGSVVYTNFPNIPAVTFGLRVEIDVGGRSVSKGSAQESSNRWRQRAASARSASPSALARASWS